jgi:hypothetical protein
MWRRHSHQHWDLSTASNAAGLTAGRAREGSSRHHHLRRSRLLRLLLMMAMPASSSRSRCQWAPVSRGLSRGSLVVVLLREQRQRQPLRLHLRLHQPVA